MRNILTIKDVLEIVLKAIPAYSYSPLRVYEKQLLSTGLCWIAYKVLHEDERRMFENYLVKRFPNIDIGSEVIWPHHQIKPRVKWLKSEISRLERKERWNKLKKLFRI